MSWSGWNLRGVAAHDRAGAVGEPVGLARDSAHVGTGLALGAGMAAVVLTDFRDQPAAWVVVALVLMATRYAWVRLARREPDADAWAAADTGPDDHLLVDLAALERATESGRKPGSDLPMIRPRSSRETWTPSSEPRAEAGSLLATALASIGLDEDEPAEEAPAASQPDEAPAVLQPNEAPAVSQPDSAAERSAAPSAMPLQRPRERRVPQPVMPEEPESRPGAPGPPRGRHAGRPSQPGRPAARHASGMPLRRVPRQRTGGAEPPALPPPLARS